MAFMDGTIVNVALPELQRVFAANLSRVQWVLESYQLFSAALLLVCGALGDHYGRRKAFAAGTIIFLAASIWCGLSPQVEYLIVARAVQGVGAALLIPTSLSLLASAYPENERGRAIGTWSAWTSVCAALGPVAGGWLIQHASWRWIFFLNVPLGILTLLFLVRVQESRSGRSGERARLDWRGAMLITAALAALVLGLLEGPARGWRAPAVLAALIAGGVLFTLFLLAERKRPNAMMPLSLFRSRDFSAVNALTFLLYASLNGAMFFLPFSLIQVRGFTATQAGAAFLPLIVLMFLFSARVGGLVGRVGARSLLVAGASIAGAGFALFAILSGHTGYIRGVLPAVLVLGAGMTLSVTPLTTTVMNSVSTEDNGVASGVNNAVSRIAALLSVALLGAVLQATFSTRLARELEHSHLDPQQQRQVIAQRSRLHQAQLPSGTPAQQQAELRRILDTAFRAAFDRVMLLSALGCIGGALVVGAGMSRRNQHPA